MTASCSTNRWRCSLVSIALLGLLAGSLGAQEADPPPTPAGRRIPEIVAVMNAGDPDATRTWLTANLAPEFLAEIPMEEHLRIWGEIHDRHGGFDVQRIESTQPDEASATLKDRRTGEWLRLRLTVEAEPPHRV
ncbi:MAG TPA: hypothetical protein VE078_00640, partial [Thermoanaerobaculia bacterium]|nr:hypothetical protein [Thermoanaerobaculia bacterium]